MLQEDDAAAAASPTDLLGVDLGVDLGANLATGEFLPLSAASLPPPSWWSEWLERDEMDLWLGLIPATVCRMHRWYNLSCSAAELTCKNNAHPQSKPPPWAIF